MSAVSAEHPRCAVVLCSYNGERFLPAQLASLKSQTVQPAVYVLSDDASTDGTWTLLQAFASERHAAGCEVVLHRNDINMGYVRHFEQALQQAVDVEVLFPCDQDDVWHPKKLERMLAPFATRPDLLILHADARLVDADGQATGRGLFEVLEVTADEIAAMHDGRAFDVLLRRNVVTGAAMALRPRLLEQALPVGEGWAHDEWLALWGAMLGEADTLNEVLVDYRQHGDNQIGVTPKQGLQQIGLGMDRSAFMRNAEARWQVMYDHANSRRMLSVTVASLHERWRHAQARARRASSALRRVAVVWREWQSGRYTRFGHGAKSAFADLLGID